MESKIPKEIIDFIDSLENKYLFNGLLKIKTIQDITEQWKTLEPFHNTYDNLKEYDIPIAQDCFGDQYFYRKGNIIRLDAETGEIDELNMKLLNWYNEVLSEPEEMLNINLDTSLEPGKLFHAFPPFCTKEGENAEIFIVPENEVIEFHKQFYLKIKNLKEGESIKFSIE